MGKTVVYLPVLIKTNMLWNFKEYFVYTIHFTEADKLVLQREREVHDMSINQLHLPFWKVFNSIFEEYIHFNQRFDEKLCHITHHVTFRK